jgi:hypothetical protein
LELHAEQDALIAKAQEFAETVKEKSNYRST